MADAQGVLVIGELLDGGIASVTGELLSAGRKLADSLGEELSVAFLGSGAGDVSAAFAQGADKVYLADSPILKGYQPEAHASVAEQICRQLSPNILLLGTTPMGRDLGPRLSWKLSAGLASDCVSLSADPGTKELTATRPVYGGKALADVGYSAARPAIATVRAKSQEPLQPDASRSGQVNAITVNVDASVVVTNVVNSVTAVVEGIKLEDASIVVGGGRGLGSKENWKVLEDLAAEFKGAVGSTRGACDEGYCEMSTQLGITSKSVAPDLYLAVGISGASQHMSGVSFSKHIAAINKDAEAPVFKASEFGVVGNWQDVLPAFHKKVKELLSE